jgi:hypothetical protein
MIPDVSVLAPFVDDDPRGYAELLSSCGAFIDAWLDAGGGPTDDRVIGFYSIFSQSLDLARPGDPAEEAEFYSWAYPGFVRDRDEVRGLLGPEVS